MKFNNEVVEQIKGDASFRKFYRKKSEYKSLIIVY